jgi:hypothetical protein
MGFSDMEPFSSDSSFLLVSDDACSPIRRKNGHVQKALATFKAIMLASSPYRISSVSAAAEMYQARPLLLGVVECADVQLIQHQIGRRRNLVSAILLCKYGSCTMSSPAIFVICTHNGFQSRNIPATTPLLATHRIRPELQPGNPDASIRRFT